MRDLFIVARQVQDLLDEAGLQSCLIGGLALQRWGEDRLTRDVDISLLTGFGHEESVADLLLARFEGRVQNAKEHALMHRVLLLQIDGIGIDIGFAGFAYEREMMARASEFEFIEGLWLRSCSAEDLIVMKAFAARPRDWEDIRGIVIRQGEALDWGLVDGALRPLAELKEDPEILPTLERIRDEESHP